MKKTIRLSPADCVRAYNGEVTINWPAFVEGKSPLK